MYVEARIPLTAWWVAGFVAVGLHVLLLQAWIPGALPPHGGPPGGTSTLSRLQIELGTTRALPATLEPVRAKSPTASLPVATQVAKPVPSESSLRERRLSPLPDVAAAPPTSTTRGPQVDAGAQGAGVPGDGAFETTRPGSGTGPSDYFGALYARVLSARDYPRRARLDGVEGTVVLGIEIDRNGQIQSSRVRESSGSRVLDRHAARIAKRAAPFGPVPPHFQETDLAFELPIQFSLTD